MPGLGELMKKTFRMTDFALVILANPDLHFSGQNLVSLKGDSAPKLNEIKLCFCTVFYRAHLSSM